MGKELPASQYTGKGYLKKRMFERYTPLYLNVASLLPPPKSCPTIIDLGCGVGYFAKILYGLGYLDYIGLDFSEDILNLAKKHMPHYSYIKANLYSKKARIIISNNSLFTMIETLEHISEDVDVIKSMPKQSTIIGSVPSSQSAGHVRVFSGPSAVVARYEKIIDFNFVKKIHLRPKAKSTITIFRGTIK